jgi:7-carboxy-7-deazaguanine synthase
MNGAYVAQLAANAYTVRHRAYLNGAMFMELDTKSVRPAVVLTPAATLPVIEIFGPTVQGEGRLVGTPVHFVRFGGCDYRCSWCDTPFAVLPEEVRKNAVRMRPQDIRRELDYLEGAPMWIIVSGGNPAILNLGPFIDHLHDRAYKVAVETQGSKHPKWFSKVDLLTLSPKPPSSGMVTNFDILDKILMQAIEEGQAVDVKIVIFDERDFEYAREVSARYNLSLRMQNSDLRFFLSQGTNVGHSTRDDLLDAAASLMERSLRDPYLCKTAVAVQQHVLYWGHKRGV